MISKKTVLVLGLILLAVSFGFTISRAGQPGSKVSLTTPVSPSTIVQDFTNTGSYPLGMDGQYLTNLTGPFPRPDSEVGNCFTTPTTAPIYNLTDAEFVLNGATGMPSGGQVQALVFSTTGSPLSNTCIPNVSTGLIARSLNTVSISSSSTGNLTFQFGILPIFIMLNPGTVYAISLRLTGCTVCNLTNFWNVAMDGGYLTSGILTFRVGGSSNIGAGPMAPSSSGMSFYYLNGFTPIGYSTFPVIGTGGGGGGNGPRRL